MAEVALALPLRATFHYRVPAAVEDLVRRGSIVVAPFHGRFLTGYVVATGGEPPPGLPELKPIREVLEPGEAVPSDLLALAAEVADYYLAPVGEVLRAALPASSVRSRLRAAITPRGREALGSPAAALRPAERALLEALAAAAGPMLVEAAGKAAGVARARERLRKLEADGLAGLEAVVGRGARPRRERVLELGAGLDPAALERTLGKSLRARALVQLLEREGGPVAAARARAEVGAGAALVRRLASAGVVRVREVEVERDRLRAAGSSRRLSELALTPAQAEAAAAVGVALRRGGFAPFLLHGVTGSGKTLVYLECIAEALRLGRSSLLLVPEIALTPVLARELRGRFGAEVALLHSGLLPGERYDAWRRVRAGRARVVFGARSAVLAPVRDLGLVIVDEEHDPSYKQDERPHYHARDVAVLRAKLARVPVLLGSATPALESYANAEAGRYTLLALEERTAGQSLPAVEVVDLREEFERAGTNVILSARLEEEMGRRLAAGEQSLLLLNRRGYASFLLCRECGARAECPNCSVCLTFHLREGKLQCHRCGYWKGTPRACPSCKGTFLHLVGHGTEKVEAAVRERFPEARVARLDRDAARGRDAIASLLHRFERGEVDILVGTQMVAKGHDFPRVTLVGVVSVDAMLALPDFRATERVFSLLTQVAGRAGRGDRPGLVVLQTFYPDNEAVKLACLQDYRRFQAREMRLRRLMRYPPAAFLANLVVRGRRRVKVERAGAEVERALRPALAAGVRLLGPAMAPVERLKRDFRVQILLKSATRPALRETLERARPALEPFLGRGTLDLDVDPQDLQ